MRSAVNRDVGVGAKPSRAEGRMTGLSSSVTLTSYFNPASAYTEALSRCILARVALEYTNKAFLVQTKTKLSSNSIYWLLALRSVRTDLDPTLVSNVDRYGLHPRRIVQVPEIHRLGARSAQYGSLLGSSFVVDARSKRSTEGRRYYMAIISQVTPR